MTASDIWEGPGDTAQISAGVFQITRDLLKHLLNTRSRLEPQSLLKRHPIDFSFQKETPSIDILPCRQELYLNRFFFPPVSLDEMTGMRMKKLVEFIEEEEEKIPC